MILYERLDPFGEPTVWIDVDETSQPVIRKSSLLVGSRDLWEVVAARLCQVDEATLTSARLEARRLHDEAVATHEAKVFAEPVDLLAALDGAVRRARERRRLDNEPCPKCGGDRLRPDFTGQACHAEARP